MTRLSTHVLDLEAGKPAVGMAVVLASGSPGGDWRELEPALTDGDGRIRFGSQLDAGRYRLVFETATPFFPEVVVRFDIVGAPTALHVPLLLSPYGYSVYRGS